ncbi:hypothetical protein [Ferruginibacter sp.]
MKKALKYFLLVLILGLIGGYIYWQQNKKRIIREGIESAIKKKTDSLYYIHYDSSRIDEINGNASFYNVSLQSDSAQKELLKSNDSLPNALFNIKVKEVKASGIDVAGLLENQNVAAKKILLDKPVVHIINTGKDKPNLYSPQDTLELYQKILGRFKSIKADTIQVTSGTVVITNIAGKFLTTLENININLNNFLVDSTRNYSNIISYFVKDIRATVENIQLPPSANDTRINIEKLDYDAIGKTLKVAGIQQYKINDSHPIIDLKNIALTELSTDAFILLQQLRAGSISCDGGLITIYKKEKTGKDKIKSMQLSSELIDEMQVGLVQLGKTKLVVVNTLEPQSEPFVLNDVEFVVSKVVKVGQGNILSDLVSNGEWILRSSGFSFFTTDKLYKLSAADIAVNNANSTIDIKKISLTPQLTEEAFMQRRTVQGDRYDFTFNDVRLQHMDIGKLIAENKMEIEHVSLQPVLKIYNDRTLPYDTRSKVGKYPHQAFLKLKTPVYINRIRISNGYIAYKERARQSELKGTVFFNKLDATIDNLTNIPEKIKAVRDCKVVVAASFLGLSRINTEWRLPLNETDSSFTVIGQLGSMDAKSLNQITEPLAMTAIKSGIINNLRFSFTGTDHASKGETQFLYNNLAIEVLKKNKNDELIGKDLPSFFANLLIKNNNPQNGNTRKGTIDFERDITKSFFNFLWKSVFDGVKRTAAGKK